MLSRLGKYEIIGEIGHGGMATVYRARDTKLDRLVALKVMHPHLQGAKEARARFAREAVTIARLRHPNILEIYDYSGEDSENSYIAAQLLTGPTLKQLVEEHADIPAEVAACMTILVARALGAAHTEGVIHRDVKPENVMLHEARDVKLTDFGIAQLIDTQGMTTTGQVLGSPGHMAPEQIEGRECDVRSDLFSLGTVLYLLATGELPFQGKNPHQVLKQIAEGQFRDPLRVKPQIGGRLRAIIMRCLEVDPTKRYASARELEDDLQGFVAECGIQEPSEFIADYLRGTGAFTAVFRQRIIEAEAALGERAMKSGDLPRAMDAFNRVLSYDERNERVLNAVRRLGRRSQLRRVAGWAALSTVLVGTLGLVVSALAPKPGSDQEKVETKPELPAQPPAARVDPGVPVNTVSEPERPSAVTRRPPERDTKRPPRANGSTSVAPKPDDGPPVDPKLPRHVILRPEPANISISVDGAPPRDFGPSFRALDLVPGPHVFKFKGAHECCVDEELNVEIPPGATPFVLKHRLRFRPAGLYVISNTPANVVVGNNMASGRSRSVIQVPQPDDMFASHVVRISSDGHAPVVTEVRLRAGQVETIEVTLQPSAAAEPPTNTAEQN
jgi:eukaryotic-like serine/threonine-protein kinase